MNHRETTLRFINLIERFLLNRILMVRIYRLRSMLNMVVTNILINIPFSISRLVELRIKPPIDIRIIIGIRTELRKMNDNAKPSVHVTIYLRSAGAAGIPLMIRRLDGDVLTMIIKNPSGNARSAPISYKLSRMAPWKFQLRSFIIQSIDVPPDAATSEFCHIEHSSASCSVPLATTKNAIWPVALLP